MPVVARELAQREGIKAVIEGELTPLRSSFVVTIRLVSAHGDELVSFSETTNQTDVIRTIGQLTRRLRGKIGESLKAVRASPPLQQVTTPSLAALRKYTEGLRAMPERAQARHQAAEEAVALDSTFAMAWTALAVAYSNARMPPELVSDASERAYRFRDRLPDRERYRAVGNYFQFGPGRDRARAVEANEAGMRLDSMGFANSLGARVHGATGLRARGTAVPAGHSRRKPDHESRPGALPPRETGGIRVDRRGDTAPLSQPHGATYEAEYLYNRGQLDSAQRQIEHDRAEQTATSAGMRRRVSWRSTRCVAGWPRPSGHGAMRRRRIWSAPAYSPTHWLATCGPPISTSCTAIDRNVACAGWKRHSSAPARVAAAGELIVR